jgi:aminoglycoside phosphotransferase family enzyme
MTERAPRSDETLAFLRRAEAHPEAPARIELVETHFAWVFLGARVVRKLRKPLRTRHFDLTTAARREAASREEVRLNRVLAPDVYLGVERVVRTADGGLALEGAGETVDWVVVMRRLPAACALDALNPRGAHALAPLAELMADYYRHAPRVAEAGSAWAERVRAALAELETRLVRHDVAGAGALARGLQAWAAREAALLDERAAAGRIVDGHGDLRPEHVYLTTPPRILDRLDFDAELRRVDWVEDTALLAVDLERLGRPWLATALERMLATRLDDRPPAALTRFYRAWRALLRAELCLEHRARPGRLGAAGWLRRAKTYVIIAERHAARGSNAPPRR